jgi:hypothetical protein
MNDGSAKHSRNYWKAIVNDTLEHKGNSSLVPQHGENTKENSFHMIKMGKARNTCGSKHLLPVSLPLESNRLVIAGTNASITMATA